MLTETSIVLGKRGVGFGREQEWIDRELERFCRQSQPDLATLPADIRRLVIHIHENLFDAALNVNAVKRSCGVRNNNVTIRFRAVVGVGIHEYIEALRMEAAGWVLREGAFRIYLVAMAIGYTHLETFCRAFQRRFGYTPSRHRKA
jgi:AraC-like DNA-binding protein